MDQEVYERLYNVILDLSSQDEFFKIRNLDKNALFIKEEKPSLEFYKQWAHENIKKLGVKTKTHPTLQCRLCAKKLTVIETTLDKKVLVARCEHCGYYPELKDIVTDLKEKDAPEYKREQRIKEENKIKAMRRKGARLEQDLKAREFEKLMNERAQARANRKTNKKSARRKK